MSKSLSSLQSDLRRIKKQKMQLIDEREEMKQAYNRLKQLKKEREKLNKRISNTISDEYDWKGDNYDAFKYLGGQAYQNGKESYDSINTILDNLNWHINKLGDRIFGLNSMIGDLATQIQNWTN